MRIQNLTASPYQLPLKHPWTDHHGRHTERKGWIIKLHTEDSMGIGECAPFPSAGTETFEQAENWLRQHNNQFNGLEIEDLLPLLDQHPNIPPAVHCGIETAAIDLLSKQANKSFSQWLNPAALNQVFVNANLGSLNSDTATRITEAKGYKVIKLKVGLSDVKTEVGLLQAMSKQLPKDVLLRLDANQAWSWDEASRVLEACQTLPIESIEEPLQNPSTASFQRLQQTTAIPVAADESLAQLPIDEFLQQSVVKRLVLKPMVHRGPRRCLELAQHSYQNDMDVVITTTLDAAVGVWMATHLATALGPKGRGMAHGLATSSWLAADLAEPPIIQEGIIHS